MSEPLLELHGVSRAFPGAEGELTVLRDVDITVCRGEFVAVMGPSGSGKSTLMNILGCLDRPTRGSYRVNGVDVAQLDGEQLAQLRRDTFGFVFQRYNLMSDLSALENVAIPAVYAGASRDVRQARARELLERLGMGDRLQHRPGQLSGGQQQRVSIARALMNGGPVILADEPTGALDSASGEEVMQILHELNAAGHTIVLITHDIQVARHAQRVIRLRDGAIVADEGGVEMPASDQMPPRAPAARGDAPGSVLAEALKMALRALAHHRLHTALTMLGIVIGVASVVAMLAIGTGAKQEVLERIQAMGTDLLSVKRGLAAVRGSGRGVVTLTPESLQAIERLPGVLAAVPESDHTLTMRYGNKDVLLPVTGTGDRFPEVRNWPLAHGVFFDAEQVRRHGQVVTLGKTAASELFGDPREAIGKYVLIGNAPFQVVGVLSEKGASSSGYDRDYAAWVPYTTASTRLFGERFFDNINVKVGNPEAMRRVEASIHALLVQLHGREDFNIRNMADLIETANQTQNALTYLLAAIAIISLLVGGIGVMNIMLVSVSERTREIGIRMAVGARDVDVLVQSLIEAVLVCALGGAVGVVLGVAVALGAGRAMGWITVLSAPPVLLAFGCAFVTGVVFGFLPAQRAARLDPVVALARE